MMSNSSPDDRRNCHRNVFDDLLVGANVEAQVSSFMDSNDFSINTNEAIRNDLRKFAKWFSEANGEVFDLTRVTVRDVVDFRNFLRIKKEQAVSTCNRALVLIRRLFAYLHREGIVNSNPAKTVKELKKASLPPEGLDGSTVRRLLRQIELNVDIRANAIFHLLLYTGARVSDVVSLNLKDIFIAEKSGQAVFRHGKGNKERTVPLPNACRKALGAYLETRPPVNSELLFIGERGPLTTDGVQSLCRKYSAFIGVRIYPHIFRHTFAKKFLEENDNDLAALALLLGHSNIQTTARYAQKSQSALAVLAENIEY